MLLRACFIILLISLVSDAILHAAMGLGTASLHRRALIAANAEIVRAATALQQSIASRSVLPAPMPTCVASDTNGCELVATTHITLANASSTNPTPLPCPHQDCTAYAQGNDLVAEGRVTSTIGTTIAATDGTVLARRDALVAFRTLAVPPYVALVGSLDATLGAVTPNGVGDDGGAPPTSANAGTLVNVLDRNSSTGTLTPANVWVPHTQNAAPATAAWDP